MDILNPFFVGAIFALSGAGAAAQQSAPGAPHHTMHLVKLPDGDYTVPMSELEGSGTSGKVTLHPEGPRTIVTVYAFGNGNHKHAFNLRSAKDCDVLGSPKGVALAPAMTGQPSRTIVSLPIGDFTSKDYVLDAQNATAKKQFEEACARF